jgi:hypothetical protein
MWNLYIVSINLLLLVVNNISIIFSIGPIELLYSNKCWANFELLLACLYSRKCSLNLRRKGLPVCPIYLMLQHGLVRWWMPLLSNCCRLEFCLKECSLLIVFCVVKVILTKESIKSFVINLFSSSVGNRGPICCPVLYFRFVFIETFLIPYLLQSVLRHLVTVVSIALETCRRYVQWSSPFYCQSQGLMSLGNVAEYLVNH